jgi:hypothetical protein
MITSAPTEERRGAELRQQVKQAVVERACAPEIAVSASFSKSWRKADDRRDILLLWPSVETSEISRLDDLALAGIKFRKAIQGKVQRNDIAGLFIGQRRRFVQRNLARVSASFGPGAAARVLY